MVIWSGITGLILIWYPWLFLSSRLERDPSRYQTGRRFRQLGKWISKVNPNWHVHTEGWQSIDPRHPYVMVSNHLSNADIPVISNLPWEMKWVAKRELFKLPFVGAMMQWAGDISVERGSSRAQMRSFRQMVEALNRNVSVIFFPEGTRSLDGRMRPFNRGAFDLAIRQNVPVLPMVISGTEGCLPKNTWMFEPDVHVQLRVLDPVPTDGYRREQADELMQVVRNRMADALMEIRNASREEVDSVDPSRNQSAPPNSFR
ncbi:MAG: lysophospholipid acyltransferase family protein [Balneolaceae bacterium]